MPPAASAAASAAAPAPASGAPAGPIPGPPAAGAAALAPAAARRRFALGVVFALCTVALWSGFILMSRYGAQLQRLHPWDLGALRMAVAGAVMLPVLLWRGRGGLSLGHLLVLTVTGALGFSLLAYHGFGFAPAAHGAILMPGVLPLYTTLLAVLFLGDRVSPLRAVALGMILCGIVALATASFDTVTVDSLAGDGLFLMASFSWACFTVAFRRWGVDPLTATACTAVGAAVLYLPAYGASGRLPELMAVPWPTLLAQGFYQGVCAVVLSMLAFTTAVRFLGPSTTTMITAAVPGVVALAAVPLLGETLSLATGLGAGLVVLGGVVSARVAAVAARAAPPRV